MQCTGANALCIKCCYAKSGHCKDLQTSIWDDILKMGVAAAMNVQEPTQ